MENIFESFIVNDGLYHELPLSLENFTDLHFFVYGDFKFDVFCTECGKESTYTVLKNFKPIYVENPFENMNISLTSEESSINKDALNFLLNNAFNKLIAVNRTIFKVFKCTRKNEHHMFVNCIIKDKSIIKYGQYPSIADFNNLRNNKYRKVLKDRYWEYNKAIGLFSHGVGIGSLVYLRRIFEDLIKEANEVNKNEEGWNEEEFSLKRMDEKILSLKEHLPKFLVENRKIYGILSKGIHDLSESECIEIFPVIKCGIDLILNEKIEMIENEKTIHGVSKSLTDIHNKLK